MTGGTFKILSLRRMPLICVIISKLWEYCNLFTFWNLRKQHSGVVEVMGVSPDILLFFLGAIE